METPKLGTEITPGMAAHLFIEINHPRTGLRPVHTVFLHCSASDHPEHDSVQVMDRWHRARNWSGVGYHLFIRKDGVAEYGRDWGRTPAAQQGHNRATLAICLHGLRAERFTQAQRDGLEAIATALDDAHDFGIPSLRFRGHREVAAKLCPVFDYQAWLGLDGTGIRCHAGSVGAGLPALPTKPTLFPSQVEFQATPGYLQKIDRGLKVRRLQQALARWGADVEIDGIFGRQTEAAVRAYQQAHWRLKTDGIAGPKTLAHLRQHGHWPLVPA